MPDTIVTKGARVLSQKAKAVPGSMFGTGRLEDMVRRMSEALRETEHGVAIAAPQIGIPYRIFVVRGFVAEGKDRSDEDSDIAFINPKITKRSRKKEIMDEACLSVPGYAGQVRRAMQATVRAYDLEGVGFERGASGLLAQIFQHECDHLDGILYIEKAEEVFKIKKEEEVK